MLETVGHIVEIVTIPTFAELIYDAVKQIHATTQTFSCVKHSCIAIHIGEKVGPVYSCAGRRSAYSAENKNVFKHSAWSVLATIDTILILFWLMKSVLTPVLVADTHICQ